MVPFSCRRVLLAASLCLSAGLFAAAEKERLPIAEFVARSTAKPPTIDGIRSPGEWDRAFGSAGMMTPFDHTLQEAVTDVTFMYDEQNFYFLVECVRGDREWKLWKSVRENDGYSFGDPSIEIWVTPPTLVPETYQNVINTYPAVLDQKMIPTRGYTAQGWQGNWTLGVTESETEYTIEAAIRVHDFDGFDRVAAGDVWRFLICRSSPGTQSRAQASWSITQGFSEVGQHPRVHLAGDSPAVRVRGITSVFTGKYAFPITVIAPDAAAEEVTVAVRWHAAKQFSDDDRKEQQTVSVAAGQTREVTFAGTLPDASAGHLTITATTAAGTQLFRQAFPYTVTGWTPQTPTRPEKAREAKPLDLMVKYGPVSNVMMLRADIIDLPTREQVAGGVIRLKSSAGDVLLEQPLPAFREWYATAHFRLDKLKIPVADYAAIERTKERNIGIEKENKKRQGRGEKPLPLAGVELPEPMPVLVEVEVDDADGQQLQAAEQSIELRRYRFPWEQNEIGITDEVIPPWTPVTCDDDQIGVWNRQLQVNGLGLLENLDNGGVSQLQQMRLVAVQNGQETTVVCSPPQLTRQVDAEADFSGSGHAAGLALSAETRVEFDGFVLSNLSIGPADGKSARIDKLFLEIVLPEAEATHFCTTAGGWTAVHAETPRYWSSLQTASGMLIGDFVPYIWLTNTDRGFLWFADNDRGWITDDDKSLPTQEVIRANGTVTLRVHFIEVPAELTAATTLTWGYQAFPSRPLPSGWRSIVCNQNKTNLPGARNTYFWFDADWAVLWPYYCSPYPWHMDKSAAAFSRYPRKTDHRPLVGSIAHSIGRYRDYAGNTFNEYAVDWGEIPGDLTNANVVAGKGPNDFRLYHYQQWVREAGFRGLYIDENYLSLEKNFLSGGAYIRPDGRLQQGYSYLGLREYFKRMMVMFHDNDLPRPNLWLHISSGAAYHSWFGDIFFEGENVEPTDEKFDYLEVLPASRMRAIGSAACSGGAMTMMCQSQRHASVYEAKHTHQFWGWVMAHDILPEQVREFEIVAQEARLYEDHVRFVGYWQDCPFSTDAPGCLVSAHIVAPSTPNRALLWIVNTSRQDQSVTVTVDAAKAGLDAAGLVAVNAETGAILTLAGGQLTVPVLQRDFVAVHLIDGSQLAAGQTIAADFDHGRDARAAWGSPMFLSLAKLAATEQLPLVAGRSGKALAVGQGIGMWPHLHLSDAAGRLVFAGLVPAAAQGTICETTAAAVRDPQRPPVPGLRAELAKGELLFGGLTAKREIDPEQRVKAAAPAPGWHVFELSWAKGQAAFTVDGVEVGTVPLSGLNIANGTGKALLESGSINFGGRRSAITALDDVACYR